MRHLDINLPCYIFGTGSFGQQTAQALLSQNMQVRAFVSNTDQRNVLDGLPILKWSQIPNDEPSQILLAVLNREHALDQFYLEAKQHLFDNVIMPWDFYGQISKQLGWQYWLQDAEQVNRHRPILDEAIKLMEDEQRKFVFKGSSTSDMVPISNMQASSMMMINILTRSHCRDVTQ